jgi:hypothetical protein
MSNPVPDGPLAPVYRLDDYRSEITPEPPVDADAVWSEVMAAAQLFGTLREAGLSVKFDSGGDGPPRVAITDLQGNVIEDMPPSVACDAAKLRDAAFKLSG